jgi:adenosylhomocysteine nucleosidase
LRLVTVLLVGAEAREFAGLLRHSRQIERLPWNVHWARSAECNGRRFVMVANGAGAARAAAATAEALGRVRPDAVVSYGFCGALDPALGVGDVFVATSVEAGEKHFRAAVPGVKRPFASGTLLTSDRVAATAAEKAALRAGGASAVEMEASGVAECTSKSNLPFFCVRSVTDLYDESFTLDLNLALRPDGHFDTMFLLRGVFVRPVAAAPELVRLWRRCRVAALKLGDFIADCRF